MKFKMLLIVIILALAAACSKKDKTEQTDTASTAARDTVATTPAVAAYRAFGNEPFWSVTINAEGLHFVSPEDTIGMHFAPVEAVASGDTLRWASKSDRGSIDVRIWPGSCSDGMSDNTWSYSSNAQLNEMTYIGCAEKK
jgi:uncharacterized membrane protein